MHFFTFIKSPSRTVCIRCRISLFRWHVCQVSLLNLDFKVVLLDNISSVVSPKFQPFLVWNFIFVVLWYFFSAMPQVWSKLYVPSGIYGNFPTTFWFLAFPGDLTCIAFPTQNNWYKILKLVLEILQTVHYPMKLVSLNLDTLGKMYDCLTWNTFLRLVNRTSQIPYLPQGVYTNVRWPKSYNILPHIPY